MSCRQLISTAFAVCTVAHLASASAANPLSARSSANSHASDVVLLPNEVASSLAPPSEAWWFQSRRASDVFGIELLSDDEAKPPLHLSFTADGRNKLSDDREGVLQASSLDDATRDTRQFLGSETATYPGEHAPLRNPQQGLEASGVNSHWLAQPSSIGMFFGGFDGEALVNHRVDQTNALFFGAQYGWDYNHRWGVEKRFGYAQLYLQEANLLVPTRRGTEFYGDYRLLFYPCGDAIWRPYFMGAIGGIEYHFVDDLGNAIHRPVFTTSYGIGLKRLLGERIALRVELADIVTFESGELSGAHTVSLVGGIEYRFSISRAIRSMSSKVREKLSR